MEVVMTVGDISRAKLQSNCHHQQTNTQLFAGRMPFLLPNRQCQSTEGKACANLPKNTKELDVGFFLDVREDMEFLEVLTEGLNRVLMVRGGGTEVITMYS